MINEIKSLWGQLGITEFTSDLEISIHSDATESSIGLSDDVIEKLSGIAKSLVDLKVWYCCHDTEQYYNT